MYPDRATEVAPVLEKFANRLREEARAIADHDNSIKRRRKKSAPKLKPDIELPLAPKRIATYDPGDIEMDDGPLVNLRTGTKKRAHVAPADGPNKRPKKGSSGQGQDASTGRALRDRKSRREEEERSDEEDEEPAPRTKPKDIKPKDIKWKVHPAPKTIEEPIVVSGKSPVSESQDTSLVDLFQATTTFPLATFASTVPSSCKHID